MTHNTCDKITEYTVYKSEWVSLESKDSDDRWDRGLVYKPGNDLFAKLTKE